MRVVVFGTYDAAAHPRVAVLRDGLAEHGFDVVEVNAPLGIGTAQRVAMLHRPWRVVRLVAALVRCWTRLARARVGLGHPEVVLVGYLGHFDVHLARLLFPRSRVVLDHLVSAAGTATDRGVARDATGRALLQLLRSLDAGALGAADVVLVDTEQRLPELPEPVRPRAVVIPVGATRDWFAAGDERASSGSAEALTVVFFGLFTPLHGAPVMTAAVAALPPGAVRLTMIGTGQELAAAQAAAGGADVTWVPWVPSAELPKVVAGHDVCLGIVGETWKARTVVPTKVFQGAAAGCAVVTSDTPAQRTALAGAGLLVPPGDASALAEALHRLAADRAELARRRAAARARADMAFTPGEVTRELAAVLRR